MSFAPEPQYHDELSLIELTFIHAMHSAFGRFTLDVRYGEVVAWRIESVRLLTDHLDEAKAQRHAELINQAR